MKLECDTFYFYPNGSCETTSKWNSQFHCYEYDLEQYSKAIRIFGTREQINKGLDDYCKASGLNLDEGLDFEDKETLKRYKKHYKNKPLIINLR